MMALIMLKFSVMFLLFKVIAADDSAIAPVSDSCLHCICHAVSGCKTDTECDGDTCGVFRITWAYWVDSGKPTVNGQSSGAPDAYQACTTDPACAARSVRGYMNRFAQDCNGDCLINCFDYLAIHVKGGYGCSGLLSSNYIENYNQCAASAFVQEG